MAQYTLTNGKVSAKVNSKGGELCSFVAADGRETIWQGNPDVWGSHSPVLFPIVGTAKDNKLTIDGKEYSIPKHGSVRKMEFTKDRQGRDFIEMVFTPDESVKAMYPFDFTLTITHAIRGNGFTTDFLVENNSDSPMPVCIGGHPGFICPMQPGERFEDYVLKFPCIEDGENSLAPNGYVITGKETLTALAGGDTLPLMHSYFDTHDALILSNIKSRYVRLIHRDTGKGLTFAFPSFTYLGIWSAPDKNAPYVCLEPWNGLPASDDETGRFEDKPMVRILAPGESYLTGYTVQIDE